MKEIRDIIVAYDKATSAGKKTALATVVCVKGSSYRREGARMLITEDGQLTGAISGGCLEGDALRKALLVMAQQKPMVVVYDTNDEDDAKLGLGLGCNGVIHILIEPIDSYQEINPITLLRATVAKRDLAMVVTIFSSYKSGAHPGTCILLTPDASLQCINPSNPIMQRIAIDADNWLKEGSSYVNNYGDYTVFFCYVQPVVSLLVFGAGNDAIPLTAMATLLGWETTVIDGRTGYATIARFPTANRIAIVKVGERLPMSTDAHTVAVLMTHNYNYDLDVLRQLMPLAHVPYIGVLGPARKLQRMTDELTANGYSYTERLWSRVHGPTGLDIGASTPEEIALSILAEIQGVISSRSCTPLRDRTRPIHELDESRS